jgi:hypothetical protein
MREFYFILVSFLCFTACQQLQKAPDVAKDTKPLVIDYPAGVIISQNKNDVKPDKSSITQARKILSDRMIPVIDSVSGEMVFIKLNGDKISVNMNDLSGKYDIVLFDAVRNPVPLRIADLPNAVNRIFNPGRTKTFPSPAIQSSVTYDSSPETDTLPALKRSSRIYSLENRSKKIVVTTPDTSNGIFENRDFPGIEWIQQRVDTRSILKINFENDLITYANTDRYFTNGITFDLQAAWLSRSPFQKMMIPYRHIAFVTYNLSMVQDMYTPTDTRVAPKLHNDRPYASYLYFGFRKITADPVRKLKLTSQFDIGYLGPYSPGSYLQTLVHKTFPTNDVPQGWETQIKTDIILNYTIKLQKALVNHRNITLLAGTDVKAGTLYNNIGAGLELQAGKAEPVFGLAAKEQWPKLECYFFAKTNVTFVAYNALLQGGLFNHDNVFTLKANEIQRVVGNAEAGFHVRYKGIGIELAQHYLTPEYKGGLWHKWGRISLLFKV